MWSGGFINFSDIRHGFMDGLRPTGQMLPRPEGKKPAQPFVYRGFMMVDENKLNELRGDQLRKIVQNGMLPLIYAHLFSLALMREVFGRQMQAGKVPAPQLVS